MLLKFHSRAAIFVINNYVHNLISQIHEIDLNHSTRTIYDDPSIGPIPLDLHSACAIGKYESVQEAVNKKEDLNTQNKGRSCNNLNHIILVINPLLMPRCNFILAILPSLVFAPLLLNDFAHQPSPC